MRQLDDRLRFHAEAIVGDRLAQVADDRDVFVAAHDAAIGVLIHLHAAAPTILRGFAGRLGVSERVRQRKLGALDGRDAEARRQCDRRALVVEGEPADRLAQAVEEHARTLETFVREEQREAIAGDARSENVGGQARADRLGDADDGRVADVHAVVLVDHVQAIDVGVGDAVLARAAFERREGALLERRTRQQFRARVVCVLQHVGDVASHHLDHAHLARIEVGAGEPLQQHQQADDMLPALADRAREDLVRQAPHRAGSRHLVQHQRAALDLHPREQVALSLVERLALGSVQRAVHVQDRDLLVRNEQRPGGALQVRDAAAHELFEIVAARVFRNARIEQQLEIGVASTARPGAHRRCCTG